MNILSLLRITLPLSLLIFHSIQNEVYICKGPESKVYHKSMYCKGLNKCSTKIYKISLTEVKKIGRRECKIEY